MFKKIVGLWFSSVWKNAKDVEKYITNLIESGAGEFFVGYNPSYWSDKFGFEVSPNGRFAEHEQVTDLETLKAIVSEVHKHKLEIFINLNAWYYTDTTLPFIEKMVSEFIEIWIDGIICWNIGILEYLKSITYSGKINISTIMAVYNREAIAFMIDNYNINKVILSREITLKEIEKLSLSFPEMSFEVFWEWDFCRYNNWLCFAEHKYGTKDICSIVVNDLIIKKRFRPDFKEIILDFSKTEQEKLDLLRDDCLDFFIQIQIILWKIDLWFLDKNILDKELLDIVLKLNKRTDLFFDWLKSLYSKKNTDILTYLRAIKYLLKWDFPIDKDLIVELKNIEEYLNNNFKTYIVYNKQKSLELWSTEKLRALELWNFYAKSDNLNLYSYLFFSKINNITTVKFPTRWRNYTEKIKIIDDVLSKWEIDELLLDRWISMERTHYDLTYIFKDKFWFRNMIKNFN